MEKIKKILIPVLLIGVLLLPIVVDYINSRNIAVKNYSEFKEEQNTSEFSLVYFGDTKSDEYKTVKDTLLDLKKEYSVKDIYSVDSNKLTEENLTELTKENIDLKNGTAYIIIKNGDIVKTINGSDENVNLSAQVNKYLNNVIPEEEIAFKTVSTYKEFNDIYKGKTPVMHVFGRNTCYYCNIFKPIYNDVAAEHNLDIYYYDSDIFDSTEYNKILNSGINIPAECSSTQEEKPLSKGFGTPLTLFTKNGKVIGCLSGYTSKDKLIAKLKDVGMLK